MKHKISFHLMPISVLMLFALSSCRSNPHKAEDIKTNMDQAQKVSGSQQVGVKDGEMVVQNKTEMSERLLAPIRRHRHFDLD